MRYLTMLVIFTISPFIEDYAQDPILTQEKFIAVFSSYSSVDKLEQFVFSLKEHGIDFTIEEAVWKNENQLEKVRFNVASTQGKVILKTQEYNYNVLNEGVVLLISPTNGSFMILSANIKYVYDEIWDVVLNKEEDLFPKRVISTFHDVVSSAPAPDMQEFFRDIKIHFADNIKLSEEVSADRDFSTDNHHYRYYYNDQELGDSFTISPVDMSCKVKVGIDPDGRKAMYITSDKSVSPFSILANK